MRLLSGAGLAITALAAGIALPVYAATAGSHGTRLAASSAVTKAAALPAPGNPNGHVAVPAAGRAVNTSHPTRVVGHGTAASCTSKAVVSAVRKGGIIRFSCGPAPVTIVMKATAKVRNTVSRVVLDGGGKVTLSGGGVRRILYMNTCDPAQVFTTSHCDDQARPKLVVQNLNFIDGNAAGSAIDTGSGGAIYASGGQFKVVNSVFADNRCHRTGPDLGGAAVRALEQYQGRAVYVVHSTFIRGVCSNGSALSSIGVSWVVLDSIMKNNHAVGNGANPARSGTPGGGSGGAIYTDGDSYTVRVAGTLLKGNSAREGGGAIFYVSDNNAGALRIQHSTLRDNPSHGFHTQGFPGIFYHGPGQPITVDSHIK